MAVPSGHTESALQICITSGHIVIDTNGFAAEQPSYSAVRSGGDRVLVVGSCEQKSDAVAVREDTIFVREFAKLAERRRGKDLSWA